MSKPVKPTLQGQQASQARMLRGELTKLRCWLSGFQVGRTGVSSGHILGANVPGEDALRQTINLLDDLTKATQP